MISILVGALSAFMVGSGAASAQPKPAPTLNSILVEQLKTSHTLQQWFVPASRAVEGLTFEQATFDEARLQSWYYTIAHIGTHNAYHTGQILYIRKQQGSWDAAKGVK